MSDFTSDSFDPSSYDYGELASWADPSYASQLTPEQIGDDVANNSCLDECWKNFQQCVQSATDGGMRCLAQLEWCRRNCR